jgi:hypothetical protein
VCAVQEILFFGYRVSPLGVSINPSRTQAIRDFPPPKDVKEILRFIGMLSFYHKFVPNLANVAAPLNALRKKGAKFSLGPEQMNFDELKLAISQSPVLRMAHFLKKTSFLQTDASGVALGAVLL